MTCRLFVFSLTLATLAPTLVAQSASVTVTLRWIYAWPASYDQDGDGYARHNAHRDDRVGFLVDERYPLVCPPGHVLKRGDLNDNDAAIHPRQPERRGNGLDDDCDGRIDEAEPCYHPAGYGNATDSFTMRLRINDPAVEAVWDQGQGSGDPRSATRLDCTVEYQPLDHTSSLTSIGRQEVVALWRAAGNAWVELGVGGLSPGTVYRARATFLRSVRNGTVWTSTSIGSSSDWYYTTTTQGSRLGGVRTALVLSGLYEFWLSEHLGAVGHLGWAAVNGTRYGAAANEWWCGDFYSTLATGLLAGMTHQKGTFGIRDYFDQERYAAWHLVAGSSWPGQLRRGDFLALDTNGDGEINHTAMFLAVDGATGLLWTLEGNTAGISESPALTSGYEQRLGCNEVFVQARPASWVVGYGCLTEPMLF